MSAIELVRKIVRQHTDKIGQPVSNLYGPVAAPAAATASTATGPWWKLANISGALPENLGGFYARYISNTDSTWVSVPAPEGVLKVTFPRSALGGQQSFLLSTTITTLGNTIIPLSIGLGSAANSVTVYVDQVVQRTFYGEGSLVINLDAGQHTIELLGIADFIVIITPAGVPLSAAGFAVRAPTWLDAVGTYTDSTVGIPCVALRWHNDITVGGWRVYRRQPRNVGRINRVSEVDATGHFFLEFSGDSTAMINPGQDAITGSLTIGTVLSDAFDALNTAVTVQLSAQLGGVQDGWRNQDLYVSTWQEVAQVHKTGTTGVITWNDTAVASGQVYEYALRAHGVFDDTTLGDFSAVLAVTAGDSLEPGSITLVAGYPITDHGVVTVKFVTPTDLDYAGVKVFYRDTQAQGTSTGSNTATTLNDTNKALGAINLAGYTIQIVAGTGSGQSSAVLSNTATRFTLDPLFPWTIVPDATSQYVVFFHTHVVTDYGVPQAQDELTFTVVGEGLYTFCSFDHIGNIQGLASGVMWVYVPAVEVPVPITHVAVNNRSSTGKVESNLLGITVYSVPAAVEVVLETFDAVDGAKFAQLYSNTSDGTGNTRTTVIKTGAGWTVDQYAGKWVQLTNGLMVGKQALIGSNTSTVLTLNSQYTWPVPPDTTTFKIWDQVPDIMPASTMGGGAGTENWSLTDATTVVVLQGRAVFIGPKGKLHEMYLDSSLANDYRYEAVVNRGGLGHFSGSQITGTNLTYRGDATNANRWEYGITHSSDSIVNIRYRYFSGGAGTWFGLYSGYAWGKNTAQKLIVELDGNVHTFKIADAFGHNERILGRVTSTAGLAPAAQKVGWYLRGNSGDDWLDNTRVLRISDLVRIDYSLSPDDDTLQNSWFTGKVSSATINEFSDQFQQWVAGELVNLRVLITAGPGAGNDRRIIRNTSTQVVPDYPFSSTPTTASTYMIYDTQYVGTEKVQFWRQSSPLFAKSVRFHGERELAAPEVEQRVLVDANTVPELDFTISKITEYGAISAADISAQIYPDDDVKRWELYMRKGAIPTLNGTQTGVLDPQFKRLDVPVKVTERTIQVGIGTWYCAAVGYDSNGTPGTVVHKTLVVAITGVVDTALSNLATASAGTNIVRVSWNHTSDVESPSAVATIDLYATDSTSNSRQLITSAMQVWREGVGNPNTVSGSGYFDDNLYRNGSPKVYPYTTVAYEIELVLNGVYQTTYTTQYSFYGYYLQ